MRKIDKSLRYLLALSIMLVVLFVANVLLFVVISLCTNNQSAYVYAKRFAECLTGNSQDSYEMTGVGQQKIDEFHGFAMLIAETGNVVWEYNMPQELPREYTRKDIASFTRWYLKDYPVYTWIMDKGIFVVGKPKDTVWKFELIYSMDTVQAYVQYIPYIFLVDILLLIFIPFLVLRKHSRIREQERTAWIAGVSHDIRTPLSLVLGKASIIKTESSETSVVQNASVIEQQALRMRTLVTNLNTENKLSFGMGHWNKEEIGLASMLRDIVCEIMNRELGEQYEFELCVQESMEKIRVWADRELVRRLIDNLINNSIGHNPNGCHIIIRLEENSLFFRKGTLTIMDDGIGVSKEQLKYFNKIILLKKLPDHGLGIRLIKHIGKLHHWRVKFEKNKDSGLVCRVEI